MRLAIKHLLATTFIASMLASSGFIQAEAGAATAGASTSTIATLPTIEAETFDGDKFVFPQDLAGKPFSVVFLSLSSSRETGEALRSASIAWQSSLKNSGGLPEGIQAYHFLAMGEVPFFVEGMVTDAMAEAFESSVASDRSGLLFLEDIAEFSKHSQLIVDEGPDVLLISASGEILEKVHGEANDKTMAALKAAIAKYSQ